MNSPYSAAEVREFVLSAFSRLARREVEPSAVMELILIGDGQYRGRSFRWAGWMANWLIETGLITFYSPRGDIVRTIDLRLSDEGRRCAA